MSSCSTGPGGHHSALPCPALPHPGQTAGGRSGNACLRAVADLRGSLHLVTENQGPWQSNLEAPLPERAASIPLAQARI